MTKIQNNFLPHAAGTLLLLLALTACATTYGYTKPGVTYQDYLKDRYECLQQSQQQRSYGYIGNSGGEYSGGTVASCSVAASCMAARGYSQIPNGGFLPPPGTRVDCSN